jgi:hypothetical protein
MLRMHRRQGNVAAGWILTPVTDRNCLILNFVSEIYHLATERSRGPRVSLGLWYRDEHPRLYRELLHDYVNLFHLEKDMLREKLSKGDVLSVAITTTLYVIPEPIIAIVEFIRKCNPSVKIIVGGPFIANQLSVPPLQHF